MVSTLRLGAFAGVLLLMAAWELASPRRRLTQQKARRWFINLTMTGITAVLVQLLLGAMAFSAAVFAQQQGWGLLHWINWPPAISIIIAILWLDFGVYLQHILFHAVPILWRLHMVHHTDLDFDVTTGIRFHPIEILLSLCYKIGLIMIIGASPWAVVAFEILLNAAAQFNHGNIYIPLGIDRWLRWILVTPDVHRIHHSTSFRETNSNFGFSITWWDRLCGTFRNQPKLPHADMEIGLRPYRHQEELRLISLLAMPFSNAAQKKVESYSLRNN